MPLYLLYFRPEQAPSMLAPAMTLQELRDRMSGDSQLSPLVYPGGEHYYMQSPLWPGIMPDVDMQGAPFSCLLRPGEHNACHALLKSLSIGQSPKAVVCYIAGQGTSLCLQAGLLSSCSRTACVTRGHVLAEHSNLEGMVERQVARMWLSPKGAVSPLHYDSHMSVLTQVSLLFHTQARTALHLLGLHHVLIFW